MTEKPTCEELEQRVKDLEKENAKLMHMEKALRESEEKFSKTFHGGPSIAGISDIETGEYIDVNQSFYDKLGFTPGEVIGKRSSEVVRMDIKFSDRVIAEMKRQGNIKNEDVIIYTKNGTPMNVSFFAEIIELGGRKYNYATAIDITDRKQAEEALNNANIRLEEKVNARTIELEEMNLALKVLLKHRDEDKKNTEEKIVSNLKEMVFPFLDKLQASHLNKKQSVCLEIVQSHLDDIVAPFFKKLSSKYSGLTPAEMKIAGLIKNGKNTKEIADLLGSTANAVKFHRASLRRKLGLLNEKINLSSHLSSIS